MTYAIKRNPFIPNFPLQQNQSNNPYFNSFQYLFNWFVDRNDKETIIIFRDDIPIGFHLRVE